MSNLDTLRLFIENAPEAIKRPPQEKHTAFAIGIRGDDFVLCDECWSRIIRRGCSIPKPNQILWSDTDEMPDCDLKEFH